MRKLGPFLILVLLGSPATVGSRGRQSQGAAAPAQSSPQSPASAPASSSALPAAQSPATANTGPVIILDPAHGGTDTGARGGNGAIEKDIVLQYARAIRTELQREDFRVVLTREDDSNPSYDDRAAMANTYRNIIFVSLHVSSSGAPGTVRVYYYRFGSTPAERDSDASGPGALQEAAPILVQWEKAQSPFTEISHHLADTLQSEFAQHFSGSPVMSTAVPVRELRSVSGSAVAVEVSSVTVSDPNSLAALTSPLASTIAHALAAFRSSLSGASN